MSFNCAGINYVDLPNSGLNFEQNEFSISAWVCFDVYIGHDQCFFANSKEDGYGVWFREQSDNFDCTKPGINDQYVGWSPPPWQSNAFRSTQVTGALR